MNYSTDTTLTIPDPVLHRLAACTGASVKVWMALHHLAGATPQHCEATYQTIAETAGISRRTAIHSLHQLTAAGLVAADRKKGGTTPNSYTLLPYAGA